MEGIQHRWDCPAKDGSDIHVYAQPWISDASQRLQCDSCGRAALIQHPERAPDEQ